MTERWSSEKVERLLLMMSNLDRVVVAAAAELSPRRKLDRTSLVVLCSLDLDGPHRPIELQDRTGLSSGGISKLVERLEAALLVKRAYDAIPGDHRGVLVSITGRGRTMISRFSVVVASKLAQAPVLTDTVATVLDVEGPCFLGAVHPTGRRPSGADHRSAAGRAGSLESGTGSQQGRSLPGPCQLNPGSETGKLPRISAGLPSYVGRSAAATPVGLHSRAGPSVIERVVHPREHASTTAPDAADRMIRRDQILGRHGGQHRQLRIRAPTHQPNLFRSRPRS